MEEEHILPPARPALPKVSRSEKNGIAQCHTPTECKPPVSADKPASIKRPPPVATKPRVMTRQPTKQRPEIKIISSQPISDVGFRDVSPLQKSESPKLRNRALENNLPCKLNPQTIINNNAPNSTNNHTTIPPTKPRTRPKTIAVSNSAYAKIDSIGLKNGAHHNDDKSADSNESLSGKKCISVPEVPSSKPYPIPRSRSGLQCKANNSLTLDADNSTCSDINTLDHLTEVEESGPFLVLEPKPNIDGEIRKRPTVIRPISQIITNKELGLISKNLEVNSSNSPKPNAENLENIYKSDVTSDSTKQGIQKSKDPSNIYISQKKSSSVDSFPQPTTRTVKPPKPQPSSRPIFKSFKTDTECLGNQEDYDDVPEVKLSDVLTKNKIKEPPTRPIKAPFVAKKSPGSSGNSQSKTDNVAFYDGESQNVKDRVTSDTLFERPERPRRPTKIPVIKNLLISKMTCGSDERTVDVNDDVNNDSLKQSLPADNDVKDTEINRGECISSTEVTPKLERGSSIENSNLVRNSVDIEMCQNPIPPSYSTKAGEKASVLMEHKLNIKSHSDLYKKPQQRSSPELNSDLGLSHDTLCTKEKQVPKTAAHDITQFTGCQIRAIDLSALEKRHEKHVTQMKDLDIRLNESRSLIESRHEKHRDSKIMEDDVTSRENIRMKKALLESPDGKAKVNDDEESGIQTTTDETSYKIVEKDKAEESSLNNSTRSVSPPLNTEHSSVTDQPTKSKLPPPRPTKRPLILDTETVVDSSPQKPDESISSIFLEPVLSPDKNNQPILPSEAKPTSISGPHCVALYSYNTGEENDLVFNEGDVIQLHKKVSDEWLRGQVGAICGIFPLAFVRIIEDIPDIKDNRTDEVITQETQDNDNNVYDLNDLPPFGIATFDFNTGVDGDLSFTTGQVIRLLFRKSSDWLFGKIDTTGECGIFPAGFVTFDMCMVHECNCTE